MPTATTQNAVITSITDGYLTLAADDESGLYGVMVTSAAIDLAKHDEEQLAIVGIDDGAETWNGLGNFRRDETYTIKMACLVFRPGADEAAMRAARDRGYTIFNAAAEYVRLNPHHGGVTIAEISGVNLTQDYLDTSRWVRLDWGVRVQARIEVV
jgi:hypothetical protein